MTKKNINNVENLISIIVPIYNVEKYLPNCIESILNQTYKNIEVILIDDGSPDNCGQICDDYSKNDSRIKVIHKQNGGLSAARNSGLDIAKGEYIGFVDSDDWISLDMYETLLNLAKNNNADIAQCEFLSTVSENIEVPSDVEVIKCFTNIEALNNLYNDMYVSTVVSWNKLYKRSLFDGVRFPVGKIHEDEGTTYKLLYKSNKITYINKKLYFYRQTPNSIMNSAFNKKRLAILDVFDEKLDFMSKINNGDLYAKTLKWYFFSLINIYFECKKNMANDNETLSLVKSRISDAYSKYQKAENHELKWLILFSVFRISPNLYKFIINRLT